MKRTTKMCIALAAAAVITGQTIVHAEEADKPTAGVDLGLFSKYVWRGYALSKDSLVVQPSVTLGYKGVSLNVWGNLDTKDYNENNDSNLNETDITLSYSKSIGIVNLTGGYIYYGIVGEDSQELFASIGLNTILKPTLSIYREIAITPAWYVNFGVSHSFDIVNKITLDLAGSVGYIYSNDSGGAVSLSKPNDPNAPYRAFHNGLVSAGFTIPFGEYFSVKPMIAYSFALSSEAEDKIKELSYGHNGPNFLYGGVTVSMAF